MKYLVLAMFVISLSVSGLFAQIVDTGSITGAVRDKSGAVIPNASVTLLNSDTGIATSVKSNAEGLYVSGPLHVGDYDVQVESAGFEKSSTRIHLDVAQSATVDVVLLVGANTQTVSVSATVPLLETSTATLSNLQTLNNITNLPLNSRNFSQLMSLAPDVIQIQAQQAGALAITEARGSTTYTVNGSRLQENSFLLDGIRDNDNDNGNGLAIYPPLDAIAEFRQENSVADARYGLFGGGVVNLIYKSGTKNFHGDLFEFLRNSSFDAKNYFDSGAKPEFRMHQFGASVGGPLFPRRNPKVFFFVDYQGLRTHQGVSYLSTVPTAAYRTGNFSGATQIYDPLTTVEEPNGTYSRSPFTGNVIPAGRIDPVGQNIMNLFPAQNLPGAVNNYYYAPLFTDVGDEGDLKIDYTFSASDNGYGRYSHARDNISTPGPYPPPAVGGNITADNIIEPSNQIVLSENHVFSRSAINEARFGFSRLNDEALNENYGKYLAEQLGIGGSNVPGEILTSGLPTINVTGATAVGESGLAPAILISNDYQWDDDVTLIRGRQTITLGGEALWMELNAIQTGNERGTMTFGTQYSDDPALTTATGLGYADLLLGKPASGSLAYMSGLRGFRRTVLSFYGQDKFAATRNLTLTGGIRYENPLDYPWVEVQNRMYQFVAPDQVLQVGTNGIPRNGITGNPHDFMPRVGVAYRLGEKTVVRSGYGIFFSVPGIAPGNSLAANPPEIINTSFTNNQYDFLDATSAATGFSRSVSIPGSALTSVDPNLPMPYTQQWNLSVERQLIPSTLLTVAYVGAKATHLNAIININQPVPGTTSTASRRPYPVFSNISQIQDIDPSNYNALQVTAERRLTNNLTFHLAYAWSHALDWNTSQLAGPQDNYNPQGDYGNGSTNVPNSFSAAWTYNLPFQGHGVLLRQIVQGWQWNGIFMAYSGFPFSVMSATSTLNNGQSTRAQLIGPGNGSLPSRQRNIHEWFNIAAYGPPGYEEYGNSQRNSLRGPPTRELDTSFFKNFYLHPEGVTSLQVRGEFFNIANTPLFNLPNATVGAAGAGTITSAGAPQQFQRLSREIQLGMKLYF